MQHLNKHESTNCVNQSLLKLDAILSNIDELAVNFKAASPWPSIVFDDVLNVDPQEIENCFPSLDWAGWSTSSEAYQAQKRNCADIAKVPKLLKEIIHELNEPAFLRLLEKLTGIPSLIPDPYLDGAGLHSSGAGGILAPHTDFHLLESLHLYRQINIVLYLNPDWDDSWGGSLGFYKKGDSRPTREIVPAFGRMVVFRTDHNSVHGFTNPIKVGHTRNSIALFYYTSHDAGGFGGDTTTYWQEHGQLSLVGNAQLRLYKGLLAVSTLFSRGAHAFNPHTGRWKQKASKIV